MSAFVVTPYAGTGTKADPYRPLLGVAFPVGPGGVDRITDVTGRAVSAASLPRGAYVVEVAATDARLAAIEADGRFVLLYETGTTRAGRKLAAATLTNPQANAARTWLKARGFDAAAVDAAVVAGRTRAAVAADLVALFR